MVFSFCDAPLDAQFGKRCWRACWRFAFVVLASGIPRSAAAQEMQSTGLGFQIKLLPSTSKALVLRFLADPRLPDTLREFLHFSSYALGGHRIFF